MAKSKISSKNELNKFLSKHKRTGDQTYTHTMLPNMPICFPGSYTIDPNDYDKFLSLYYASVFEYKNEAYLTERHLDFAPVLIDLDFRFPPDKKERQYETEFITQFLEIYMELINNIMQTDLDNTEIFVLDKTKPKYVVEKDVVKDGIHIMIPSVITYPRIQYILRYRMIHDPRTIELFNKLGQTNTLDDVIDICVIETNNWQMYGSRKPNCEAYKVTKMYKYSDKTLSISNKMYDECKLLDLLSLRNISNEDLIGINDDAMEDLDHDFETMPGNHKGVRKTKVNKKNKSSVDKKNSNSIDSAEYTKIIKLVDILSAKRASNHDSRIRVGWCLHNIDDRLLNPWIEFSNKSNKYTPGVYEEKCKNEWNQMDENGLGIGTLYMWAKEDNYGKFKELTANDLRRFIVRSLSATHYDIANVMYQMYKDEFIYTKSKSWYQYDSHRWHRISDGIALKRKISNELLNEYMKFTNEITNQIQQMGDDDDAQKEVLLERNKKISSIGVKLRLNSFKKNIMDECIELFYNADFEDKLDTNVNLIGFENGIYDLNHGFFRDGNPDDYVSFSTKIDYIEYESNHELINETNQFIQQVLPNKEVREYMLTLISSFLDGKISQEKFHIWTGSGGNGKSKIIELFQNAYGDYTTVLPCSLITQKRARSETCNPVLVKTKGKRFATYQEPEAGEKINVGLMKELTGGDKITARPLYKDPIEFKPQMKQILTCNEMPGLTGNDDGTFRRIRVVQFSSCFKENPNPENPNEFPIDVYLSEKLEGWAEPFMYILIQYYKQYKSKGIFEPAIVKLHTNMYKHDTDCFAQFFTEKIEVDSGGAMIHIDEAFYQFTEWYKIAYGNTKCPSRKDLKTNMMKKYGKSDNDGNIYNGLTWLNHTNIANISSLDDGDI